MFLWLRHSYGWILVWISTDKSKVRGAWGKKRKVDVDATSPQIHSNKHYTFPRRTFSPVTLLSLIPIQCLHIYTTSFFLAFSRFSIAINTRIPTGISLLSSHSLSLSGGNSSTPPSHTELSADVDSGVFCWRSRSSFSASRFCAV